MLLGLGCMEAAMLKMYDGSSALQKNIRTVKVEYTQKSGGVQQSLTRGQKVQSRREREMDIIFSRFKRRKRIPTGLFEKSSMSAKLCQSYCDSQSFRESESFTFISLLCQECDFSSNAMHKSWQLFLHVRASPHLDTTLLKYFPKCCSFCCY